MPRRVAVVSAGSAVVAVLALAACAADLDQSAGGNESPTTTTSEPSSTTSTPPPSPSASGGLPMGLHAISKEIGTGVEINVTIEVPNWQGQPNGGYMCWIDCEDRDRSGAVIAFNDREYFPYQNPCRWSSTGPDAPVTTARELVAALSRQELRKPSRPETITLDGHPGKKVILRMDEGDLSFEAGDFPACDDAHFALFGVAGENPARWSQQPGQIEEVWAVDVDGVVAVLIGLYYPETPQEDVDEVRALLGSMTFDG